MVKSVSLEERTPIRGRCVVSMALVVLGLVGAADRKVVNSLWALLMQRSSDGPRDKERV